MKESKDDNHNDFNLTSALKVDFSHFQTFSQSKLVVSICWAVSVKESHWLAVIYPLRSLHWSLHYSVITVLYYSASQSAVIYPLWSISQYLHWSSMMHCRAVLTIDMAVLCNTAYTCSVSSHYTTLHCNGHITVHHHIEQ